MEQIDWPKTVQWVAGIVIMAITATVGAIRGLHKDDSHEGHGRLIMGSIVEAGRFEAFVTAMAAQTSATGALTTATQELSAIMKAEAKHEEEAAIRADERRKLRSELGIPPTKWLDDR